MKSYWIVILCLIIGLLIGYSIGYGRGAYDTVRWGIEFSRDFISIDIDEDMIARGIL